jgi:hypothetical protein
LIVGLRLCLDYLVGRLTSGMTKLMVRSTTEIRSTDFQDFQFSVASPGSEVLDFALCQLPIPTDRSGLAVARDSAGRQR